MTVCFNKWITLILFILVLPVVNAASQECLTDSGIYQDDANSPYRSALDTLYQQIDTGAKQSENFFTFSLNGTIESAEVMLYVDGVSGLNGNVEIQYWICNGTTDEAATTWNNWATYLDCGSNTIGDPVAWNWHTVGFDIFNVTEWFTNGSADSSMFTIYIEVTGGTGAKWIRWAARESATVEHRPYLNYTLGVSSFAVEPLAPKNGTHYNIEGNTTFNGSIIFNGSETISCWINYSDFTLQGTNLSTEIEFRNNTALADGYYNVYYECNTTADTDSGEINFYLDTNTPVITINNPANNSVFNDDFLMNFSFTDLYLYKVNYTIYNSSNHVVGGNASGELPGNTVSYNFTDIFDVSAQGNGSYHVNISATDTHTRKEWGSDITYIKSQQGTDRLLTVDLPSGNLIITFPPMIDFNVIRDFDRFRFNLMASNINPIHNIFIEAEKIVYLPNSPYEGHFIINNEAWLDWLGNGLKIVKVEQIKKGNKYKVALKMDKDNIISDSLGGLNEISKRLDFDIDTTAPFILSNLSTITANSITDTITFSEAVNVSWGVGDVSCSAQNIYNTTIAAFNQIQVLNTAVLLSETTYYINFTYWDSVGNYNNTCYAFDTLPPIKWQYVTMNISNGSQINISLLNGYISSRFFSWNETPQTIDIWLNGTKYCSQSMANMTYLTPCDLTGLSFNTTYYGFSNTTYNTTYFWFEVTNTTRYTSSYDESDIFTGLALFILTNVALYVLMFFLITNMTVNVEKLVQKYEGQQPNHVVSAIKIDLAIKGASLACLTILNLIICGYTYYTSQEITAELANLAFPFFLFNVITSFSLLLMYVIKIFFFPFEYVRGLVADFDESMKK